VYVCFSLSNSVPIAGDSTKLFLAFLSIEGN
jgi:hypothetical protein